MDAQITPAKKRKKPSSLPIKFDYVVQPNRWTDARYETSLIGQKLLNAIIFNLQDAIQISFKNEDYTQLTLWKDCNYGSKINIKIPLRDISIPQHYDRLKSALKSMVGYVVEIPTEKKTIRLDNLLTAEIPETPNYSSVIDIYMEKHVAKWLIEIEKDPNGKPIQWTRFMYQVAQSASNKYTSKIYQKLCSWRTREGFVMSEGEFRKWLLLEDKYKDFYDLKKRILIPVQEDLKRMGDIWFNCNVKDFTYKQNNTVYLHFKIISNKTIDNDSKTKDEVLYLLRTHFKFEERHIELIKPIFDEVSPLTVKDKILELYTYYSANSNKIADITSYTIRSLQNQFCSPKLL